MNDHEVTERMCLSLLERLSSKEQKIVFRCARDLEKRMAEAGKLGVLALSLLAVQVQAGKRPGQFILETPKESSQPEKSNESDTSDGDECP